jgi:hypothetical protein
MTRRLLEQTRIATIKTGIHFVSWNTRFVRALCEESNFKERKLPRGTVAVGRFGAVAFNMILPRRANCEPDNRLSSPNRPTRSRKNRGSWLRRRPALLNARHLFEFQPNRIAGPISTTIFGHSMGGVTGINTKFECYIEFVEPHDDRKVRP